MTIHAETNIYIALKAIAIVDAEGEYLSASYARCAVVDCNLTVTVDDTLRDALIVVEYEEVTVFVATARNAEDIEILQFTAGEWEQVILETVLPDDFPPWTLG